MPGDKLDEEKSLPRATVDRLIHDLLGKSYTVSRKTKDALKEACQLFLNKIILEANQICETEKKKIIANQHICKAMNKQGFSKYVEACLSAASDYDDYSRHRPSKQNKFKDSGKTLDELHEDQMRLFEKAKLDQEAVYGIDNITDNEEDE